MNFIRNLRGKFVQASRFEITVPTNRSTDTIHHNPFVKNYEPQSYNQLNGVGRYIPLEVYHHYRNEILNRPTNNISTSHSFNENHSRKRTRDSSNDDQFDAKRRLVCHDKQSGRRDDEKRRSFDADYSKKRARDSHDEDYYTPKRQRLDETSVQYAIKQPSQYANPNRKILKNLFDPEITADGWEKNGEGFKYHTQIRGKCFYESGDSIDDAKELVAEKALQELCNFKREKIFWPDKLLPYRLDQKFADEIERMVKNKFHQIMERHQQFIIHRVRAAIIMTDGISLKKAKVVAIGTGTKCLNVNFDEAGTVLHDMHAEVLARRSFVRFLYDQLNAMMNKKSSIFQSEGKEIRLKEGLKFHLYVNAIPCGDARVFSLRGCLQVKNEAKMGSLRYKIIGGTRPISENTFRTSSLSCSDKIARWNVLGLQGSFLSKFIKPIYLESIVLGSSYTPIHLYRAIIGRLDNVMTDLPNDYCVNKPKFESTSLIETESFTSSAYGVCWSDGYGDENAPEILNLHSGLTISGQKSVISKLSFMNMFKSINKKLPVRSDEGIAKFQTAKEKFYTALKKENFGAWEKNPIQLLG